MSKKRTAQIERGIERNYRSQGRSAADAHRIAGAVMGNIKRERQEKGERGFSTCMRSARRDRQEMGESEYKQAVKRCRELGK